MHRLDCFKRRCNEVAALFTRSFVARLTHCENCSEFIADSMRILERNCFILNKFSIN